MDASDCSFTSVRYTSCSNMAAWAESDTSSAGESSLVAKCASATVLQQLINRFIIYPGSFLHVSFLAPNLEYKVFVPGVSVVLSLRKP